MTNWLDKLRCDPITPLLSISDEAINFFVLRDLLGEKLIDIGDIIQLSGVQRIIEKQRPDGSWTYRGNIKVVYPPHHYPLVETWKQFRVLVEKFELTRRHPVVAKAAEYLFSCQTDKGDIRGMIGNQYATYYTGAILSLLIKAGYEKDLRVEKGIEWLLSMRQYDGGWTVPMQTHKLSRIEQYKLTTENCQPLEPDCAQPFAHNCTGMVLRALAVHPAYRKSVDARKAGELLKSRFFRKDAYTSYQAAGYWLRFQFPFWWNNLLAAMTTLRQLTFIADDKDIKGGLDWFIQHQQPDGLWLVSYAGGKENSSQRAKEEKLWISLAICRMLKSYLS